MFRLLSITAGALIGWTALAADIAPGDARRGEQLFQSEHCVECHSFKGRGGKLASDIARRIDRDYTPAVMASLMWNHAPDMWEAMSRNGVSQTSLSPEAASDLFAYFVAARYFERRGDAARGKQAFSARHCAECHGITSSPLADAPPVVKWESLAEPVVLAQQMWNHGPKMREQYAKKKLTWSRLTAQELTDMLVYLQHLPETKDLSANFAFPPSDSGQKLFASKGCSGCHTPPKMALENRLRNQTLTEIAVDMWNHQASMKNPPPELSQEEMRQIIAYVWTTQYFRSTGSAERGKKVFAEKSCATCHEDAASGAPKLTKGKSGHSEITMVAALWDHGPRMLEMMKGKQLAWPHVTAQQMTDLIAYLNSL
jgi:mono/diheme cytochrome c family protein